MSTAPSTSSEALKEQGNAAYGRGEYELAVKLYSQALEVDSANHVLYSNRSAAHAAMGNFDQALEDANECVKLNPAWIKGHTRKAAAETGLKRYKEASETYRNALEMDAESTLLWDGLANLNAAITVEGPATLSSLTIAVNSYKEELQTERIPPSERPKFPDGSWVTMITPFTADNKIDWVG